MESQIKKCTCEHKYQDQQYGSGNRVFNPKTKDGRLSGYACSVCGKQTTEGAKK